MADRIIAAIFLFIGLVIGIFVGMDKGWKARVDYEARQCLEHGRCFH